MQFHFINFGSIQFANESSAIADGHCQWPTVDRTYIKNQFDVRFDLAGLLDQLLVFAVQQLLFLFDEAQRLV